MKWSGNHCNQRGTSNKAESSGSDVTAKGSMPSAWTQRALGLVIAGVAAWSVFGGANHTELENAMAVPSGERAAMQHADIIDDILDILDDIIGGGGEGEGGGG